MNYERGAGVTVVPVGLVLTNFFRLGPAPFIEALRWERRAAAGNSRETLPVPRPSTLRAFHAESEQDRTAQ